MVRNGARKRMIVPQSTRLACYALIRDEDDKILLCRLSKGIPHAGKWTLPGGGIEFGEDLKAGVKREVLEETGLTVDVTRVLDAHSELYSYPDRQSQAVRILFEARVRSGEIRFEEDGSTDMCGFFSVAEIENMPCVELVFRTMQFVREQSVALVE